MTTTIDRFEKERQFPPACGTRLPVSTSLRVYILLCGLTHMTLSWSLVHWFTLCELHRREGSLPVTQLRPQILPKCLSAFCLLSQVRTRPPAPQHRRRRSPGEPVLTPKALGSPVRNVSTGRGSGAWVALGVGDPTGGSSNCTSPGGWHMEEDRLAGGGWRPLALLGGMTTNTPLLVRAADMVLRDPGGRRPGR